jgi:hypothetical protein
MRGALTGLRVWAHMCAHFLTSFAIGSVSYTKIQFIIRTLAQNVALTLGYFNSQVAIGRK